MFPHSTAMMVGQNSQSAIYIGSVTSSATGTANLPFPSGTQVGDLMLMFGPYNGDPGPTGGWTPYSYVWSSYGYTSKAYWKVLTSTDLATTIYMGGVTFAPACAIVYRGPTSASLVSFADSVVTGESPTGNLTFSHSGKGANAIGWVTWVSDRSGDVAAATPPAGWTSRGTPIATGVFTGQFAEKTSSLPNTSGTFQWNNFSTTGSYSQVGYHFELRK